MTTIVSKKLHQKKNIIEILWDSWHAQTMQVITSTCPHDRDHLPI